MAETTKPQLNFDPKCFDLAEHFLGVTASEDAKNDLAQIIQDTVEDALCREDEPNV